MTKIPPRTTTDPSLRLGSGDGSGDSVGTLAARFKTWQSSKDPAAEARFKDWVAQAEPSVARFLFAE